MATPSGRQTPQQAGPRGGLRAADRVLVPSTGQPIHGMEFRMHAGLQRRILAVDDDARLCNALSRLLADEGYGVRAVHNGYAMQRALADESFDLVLLDLGFPFGEDGITLARHFRGQYDLPLIMLSGKDSTIDKVVCLELGADDFVTKPFQPRELLARIRTVLRRYDRRPDDPASAPAASDSSPRFGGWRFDAANCHAVPPEGTPVKLTRHECQLLEAFLSRRGRILSREQILDIVANRRWTPYDRSVDVLVAKVRRKLGDTGEGSGFIRTVRGIGYVFVADATD